MQGCYNLFYLLPGFFTSNVFVLAVAAILSFGVVAIAFGYKYRAAVFAPLPGAQLGGIARQTVPYGVALAPAQILFSLSSGICLSFVGNASGENAQGLFAFGYSLAQLVTAIQAGFSTYWGPYVYSHYRDEQERICRVHDVLNLLIFGFFCVLVMFEDIVFAIFPDKRGCLAIFPLLMLAVVFNILCEGTVYGNSIARKPWHDTIGIGLGALSNFGLWRPACARVRADRRGAGAGRQQRPCAFVPQHHGADVLPHGGQLPQDDLRLSAGVRGHGHRHAAVAALHL